MYAMPGLRAFSLAPKRGSGGICCDEQGVFVGDTPLLRRSCGSFGHAIWSVRPIAKLNDELTALYRLPVDVAAKAAALALIAAAFNRGDLAMTAIATVQMQFPDPQPLSKGVEANGDLVRRVGELRRSGLLKFWDPARHPRAGTPPNPGWFAPVGGSPESAPVIPVADDPKRPGYPGPMPIEGGGGGGGGGGIRFPSIRWPWSGGSPSEPPGVAPNPSTPSEVEPRLPSEAQPNLPFPEGLPPQLAPYKPGGPTSGIFRAGDLTVELQSGEDGPAAYMPPQSLGFDGVTKLHVEGHAAALMWQQGISDATLYINNPEICASCTSLLARMLPPGATLNVVLPDRTIQRFTGRER